MHRRHAQAGVAEELSHEVRVALRTAESEGPRPSPSPVLVERILRAVDTNEFKRRQAAPTIRVSSKAFGSGRQMPIAQRWRREPARLVR